MELYLSIVDAINYIIKLRYNVIRLTVKKENDFI